jgi:hypothetical protein
VKSRLATRMVTLSHCQQTGTVWGSAALLCAFEGIYFGEIASVVVEDPPQSPF